ncbi:hypothetical protein [Mycoplasma procyoni]|uniref:hypothetical protein n=1 Tax=Mycoplasma procyoni TaxID=568784 RepID=UPI00197C175F|nr:hypothetical protein [Mycoplasma procyoni]MBN3535014.1 hypothetical protein [Mycoplasma procyoni]
MSIKWVNKKEPEKTTKKQTSAKAKKESVSTLTSKTYDYYKEKQAEMDELFKNEEWEILENILIEESQEPWIPEEFKKFIEKMLEKLEKKMGIKEPKFDFNPAMDIKEALQLIRQLKPPVEDAQNILIMGILGTENPEDIQKVLSNKRLKARYRKFIVFYMIMNFSFDYDFECEGKKFNPRRMEYTAFPFPEIMQATELFEKKFKKNMFEFDLAIYFLNEFIIEHIFELDKYSILEYAKDLTKKGAQGWPKWTKKFLKD